MDGLRFRRIRPDASLCSVDSSDRRKMANLDNGRLATTMAKRREGNVSHLGRPEADCRSRQSWFELRDGPAGAAVRYSVGLCSRAGPLGVCAHLERSALFSNLRSL